MFDELMKAEISHRKQTNVKMNSNWKKTQQRFKQTGFDVDNFNKDLKNFKLSRSLEINDEKLLDVFVQFQLRRGHGHSDFDSDEDKNPWDEFNKTDTFTYLENKIAKKLHQYPEIELHSKIPWVDKDESGKKKEDPPTIL